MNFIEFPDFITFLRNLLLKGVDLHSTNILSGNAGQFRQELNIGRMNIRQLTKSSVETRYYFFGQF